MKLKDFTKEELQEMSYADLAEAILVSKNTKIKIIDVFKKVCAIKEMSEKEFENKIADFFELLSMDKRFTVLEKGYVDLSKKHISEIVIEEDDEEELLDIEETSEIDNDTEEENEEDIFYDTSSEDDDIADDVDELDDLVIEDEDSEEASL